MKMQYQKFVKTQMWVTRRRGDKVINIRVPLRFNPFHISSYSGSAFTGDNGEDVPCTRAYVGSIDYCVDMSIEQFDEMMDSIDIGVIIEE